MAQITRIRTLKGVGILADQAASAATPNFLRYNLIYGFNGSGKSTLVRLFSSLQLNKVHPGLPEGCSFGFELADGTCLSAPDKLSGLEERICVFNTDFVERNLRWDQGTANSIFYISKEQADAAAALRAGEAELPGKVDALAAAESSLRERTQTLATFKRGLAKSVAAKLHLANRKYEAPQLQADYEGMTYDHSCILTSDVLDAYEGVASRASPPPRANPLEISLGEIPDILEAAKRHGSATIGDTMIAELVANPKMVPWAKAGYEYHTSHGLACCLLCGHDLTSERKDILAAAFNDALSAFIAELNTAQTGVNATLHRIERALTVVNELPLLPELKQALRDAADPLFAAIPDLRTAFAEIDRVYDVRKSAPTSPVALTLPELSHVTAICERVATSVNAVNAVIHQHNEAVSDFAKHQQVARDAIKRHFLAEGHDEYRSNIRAVTDAEAERSRAETARNKLQGEITALRTKVRTHGPAADTITKLVKAYLGHGELTVVAAKEGYELHRHGKLVKGAPSEGEKTALALCYFLSTLLADGRRVKDLTIVIDDPISSLDTRAMNYACALIRTRLRDAAQLFVVTHNQHCMNEFKKDWKSLAYPRDPQKNPPTASFLYLDVRLTAAGTRSATLVEMSPLLREYDSEYHFLCSKILEFEGDGTAHSEYGYLMPNVIRRVLELFLAFKLPGSNPIKSKLAELCKLHAGLDGARMAALERLSQLESHSDSIDDFVSHSSVTIEETRDANAALLELMQIVDEGHTKAIRRQCGGGAV